MRRRVLTWWTSLGLAARVGIVALCLVFFVASLGFILKWAPELLASHGLKGKERAEDVGRTRTAVLATLAGLIAVAGAIFTGLSYRLNRAGQITERFTRAIDQLGHAELDVRLGGIYALERIARDSKDDHPQVVEVLTAYVREHARWSPRGSQPASSEKPDVQLEAVHALIAATRALERIAAGSSPVPDDVGVEPPAEPPSERPPDPSPPELPTDVQAAMSVLGRRDSSQDRDGAQLNLARTDLRRVVLRSDQANLQGANLWRANLAHAALDGANLQAAYLTGVNLRGAQLYRTNLEGANLEGAALSFARVSSANLREASLEGAQLREANLLGANLTRAILREANLIGANLEGAQLREANLQDAVYDASTRWPTEDFPAEARGARLAQEDDAV